MSNDVKKQIAKIEDEVSKLLVEQFSSRDTGDEAIKNLKWSESPEHMAKPWNWDKQAIKATVIKQGANFEIKLV